MKKIIVIGFLLATLLLSTGVVYSQSKDCILGVKIFLDNGFMQVATKNGEAFVFVDYKIWSNMLYAEKGGLCNCVLEIYKVNKVYVIKMGTSGAGYDDHCASYTKGNLKIYR
jgi:hypothetical protein